MAPRLDESVSIIVAKDPCCIHKDSLVVVSKNADSTRTIDTALAAAATRATAPPPPPPASLAARYVCASATLAIFAIWGKWAFVTEGIPGGTIPLHSWKVPLAMNIFYLVSLPSLRMFTDKYLAKVVDAKSLLKESMLLYNVGQVLLNGWMCLAFFDALLFRGHPFVFGPPDLVETGATYAVWVHYCDKYLEYLDTYFMVLRGRMDQVSFLHVYHHTSISVAWWFGLRVHPGGDAYFGALLNSFIHVLMYSYYAMALLKIPCPWKRYLTQAQLLQFTTVVVYTAYASFFGPPESRTWTMALCHGTQAFEMTSLFVLFMAFYRKTYSSKKSMKLSDIGGTINAAASRKSPVSNQEESSNKKEDSSVDDTAEQASVSSDSSLEDNHSGSSSSIRESIKKNL